MENAFTLAHLSDLLRSAEATSEPWHWALQVREAFLTDSRLADLVVLLPNPEWPDDKGVNATKALLCVAIERLSSRLALDDAMRRSLPSILEQTLYASRPFKIAQLLATFGIGALLVAALGGVFYGFQVNSIYSLAKQSQSEILSARDDAITQAQSDEREKLDQFSDKIASLERVAEQSIGDAQGAALHDIRTAGDKATADVDKLANTQLADLNNQARSIDRSAQDTQSGLRDHAQSTWAAAEATGILAINAQRDAVVEALRLRDEQANHRLDQMLGDLPSKVNALDLEVQDINNTKGNISLLLRSAPTFDRLISELDAASLGGNIRTILIFHEWGLIAAPIALALSLIALFWLTIGTFASLRRRRDA